MTSRTRSLKSADDLAKAGLIDRENRADVRDVASRYAIAITPHIANHMTTATSSSDALRRQFIPDVREFNNLSGEDGDPIGDDLKSPVKGIVHRYCDRVLLKITHICPVYCRFCFRREMVGPGNEGALTDDEITNALTYIASDPNIWEVILTGGDPLILSARRIADITQRLSAIPHVSILRWHSRVPIVDPARLDEATIAALTHTNRRVVVAIHCNHPDEFTHESDQAIARLRQAGVLLLSQTVLLRNINDNVDTLETLMRGFVYRGITPYYLHHGDLASGTGHFRTRLSDGMAFMRHLRQRLSGIALPRYMIDLPGAHGKVPVESHVLEISGRPGYYAITALDGTIHHYADVLPESAEHTTPHVRRS